MNTKLKKEQYLFKIEIFSNNISPYYGFLLFNTSLLNKNINFFKKIKNKEKCTDAHAFDSVYIITQNKQMNKIIIFSFFFL